MTYHMDRETGEVKGKTGPKPTPIEDRFWKYVIPEPNSGCWLWVGAYHQSGYGKIGTGGRSTAGHYLGVGAHRLSYEIHKGPIPDGMVIDHLCRVTCCVNPDHLEAVTHKENLARGVFLNRKYGADTPNGAKTHCKRGHPLSGENLYVNRLTGSRSCNQCRREATRLSHERQKS